MVWRMLIDDREDEEQPLRDAYRRMQICIVITVQDVFEKIRYLEKREYTAAITFSTTSMTVINSDSFTIFINIRSIEMMFEFIDANICHV